MGDEITEGAKSLPKATALSVGVSDSPGAASDVSESLGSLRASLRRQLLLHHPDKGGDAETFQEIKRYSLKTLHVSSTALLLLHREHPRIAALLSQGTVIAANAQHTISIAISDVRENVIKG